MPADVPDAAQTLITAGRVIAHEALADAFGHLSVRTSADELVITPPWPLGQLGPDHPPLTLDLTAAELPAAAPREAWIHQGIAAARPEVGGICRAQPRSVAALAVTGQPLIPLDGHGSLLGEEVAVYPDSRLIRERKTGAEVAATLGQGLAVILRGNGAVTVGATIAHAVALMWLLERSAALTLRARAIGPVSALDLDQQQWWRDRADELLPRIYRYLTLTHREDTPS